MRTNIILWLLFSCAIISFAQNRVVLKPNGEIISADETTTPLDIKSEKKEKKKINHNPFEQGIITKGTNGAVDTMSYFRDFNANTNFGIFGQDWVLQWFVAPSDMIIHKAGFSVFDVPNTNVPLEIKLVRLVWNKNELKNMGTKRLGFYRADSNGYNNISAFQDNPDRTGDWVDSSGLGLSSPFAEDVWSDSGVGMVVNPTVKTPQQNYQWIDLDVLGKEVIVKTGEVIAVAVRNLNIFMDSARVGISAGNVNGYNGFKFYSSGRFQTGIDFGWWSRDFTFDFALEIELIEGGCWPFRGNAVSPVLTSLSTGQREVSAVVHHCGLADIGKSKIELNYSFDKKVTYSKTEMTTTDKDSLVQTFKGMIPGAARGTTVYYYVSYTNASGVLFESESQYYIIPKITISTNLVVFNGFTTPSGFPQSYYFGHNGATEDTSEVITFPQDRWAYGKLTKELVDNYQNIFEITTTGPKDINNQVIREWLAASPSHNYLLAGDEYLGKISNWKDSIYAAGDFQYDILGISKDYNDISYFIEGPYPSFAAGVAKTELGDSLYLKVLALNEDSLKIDPTFRFGPTYLNWLDGFETVDGTVVDITAKGIVGKTYTVGAHRTLPAGNKIVFLAFDPLSLRSAEPNYFWYGFDRVSPLVQAMRWFGADVVDVVDVENEISGPLNFQLNQNYPNPFNPSTVISWQLAVRSFVTLKIYDVLGNEVATLVNEEKPAGNYNVDFKGNNLASGIYFYTLRAGSFVQSRKMILLK
jgi:hypothetical protein